MRAGYLIPEELIKDLIMAVMRGEHWICYNGVPDLLEQGDVVTFMEKDDARMFVENNRSDYDHYQLLYAARPEDLLRQLSCEKNEAGILSNQKIIIMNEKNYEFLGNQLKYSGFGEGHGDELKQKMESKAPEFSIFHQADFGKDNVVATLQFRRSEESDMYFFNRYSMILKNSQHPDTIKQTFYINNKEDNISFKEAYNLMSGRSVYKEMTKKEGEKYNAWLQLDFKETDSVGNFKMKQFHENYGYDVRAAVGIHPIKEMINETDRQRLMESLERGNRQSVTLVVDGKESKIFIEANPQYKTINLYDQHMKRVNKQNLQEGETNGQANGQSTGQQKNTRQSNEEGGEDGPPAAKKSKRKKQGITG